MFLLLLGAFLIKTGATFEKNEDGGDLSLSKPSCFKASQSFTGLAVLAFSFYSKNTLDIDFDLCMINKDIQQYTPMSRNKFYLHFCVNKQRSN